MKKVCLFSLITLLVLAGSALSSHAAVTQLTTDLTSFEKAHAAIDSNGNMHFVCQGQIAGTDDYQIFYGMADPTGALLIDVTQLSIGDYKGKPYIAIGPDDYVYIAWHGEEFEVHFTILDPYAHPLDGTSANALASTPMADAGNTGDGTMSAVLPTAAAALTEDWTVTYDGSDWNVVGSVSGAQALTANTGSWYPGSEVSITGLPIKFEITAGGTPFASGDFFTFSTTASEILDVPDGNTISEFNALQSVAPRISVEPDGRAHFIWYEGKYDDETFGGVRARRLDADGTKDPVFTVTQGHETYGYGGHDPEILVDDLGNTHIMFTIEDDITGSYFPGLNYALIDGSSSTLLIGVTPIGSNPESNWTARRPSMAMDADGNIYFAFQQYRDWGGTLGWGTQVILMRFDPYAHSLDGSPLYTQPNAVADAANVGDGTLDYLAQSVAAPATDWTIECVVADTAGAEIWSVSNNVKADFEYATTGEEYYSEGTEITFEITAGVTDFAVGDTFTFSTNNPAFLAPAAFAVPDEHVTHPYLVLDPTGSGLHLGIYHHTEDEYYYLQLGYDLEVLAGPTMISDNTGGFESPELPLLGYSPPSDKGPALVQMIWGNNDNFTWNSLSPTANWPQVLAVNPNSASPGDTVDLAGVRFADGAQVLFNDEQAAAVTFNSSTSLSAELPGNLANGTYDVTVVNPDTLFYTLAEALTVTGGADDDISDDDVGGDDDVGDDDVGDDDEVGGGDDDDDDDDDGCCGC